MELSASAADELFIRAHPLLRSLRYDWDVDPANRRLDPKTYGYIPDKNRGLVLGVMIAISAFTMTSQVFSLVLLLKISSTALALYLVVPMAMYVSQGYEPTCSSLTLCRQLLRAQAAQKGRLLQHEGSLVGHVSLAHCL